MKSYGLTIQMKPRQQFFHMVLFIFSIRLKNEIWNLPWILIWGLLGVKGLWWAGEHSGGGGVALWKHFKRCCYKPSRIRSLVASFVPSIFFRQSVVLLCPFFFRSFLPFVPWPDLSSARSIINSYVSSSDRSFAGPIVPPPSRSFVSSFNRSHNDFFVGPMIRLPFHHTLDCPSICSSKRLFV